MGYLRVNITNIVSPNPFKVSFKSVIGDDSAYGGFTVTTGYTYYHNGTDYSSYNTCPTYPAGTTSIEISSNGLDFNSNCWVKIEDTVTKTMLSDGTEIPRYIIENIYLHDPIAYQSCCPQPEALTAICYHDCYPPFSLTAACVSDATPTPTPTSTPTPTPTPTEVVQTPTPTPTAVGDTPTPTPTAVAQTPTPTPTVVPLAGTCYILTINSSALSFEGQNLRILYTTPNDVQVNAVYTEFPDSGGNELGVEFNICIKDNTNIYYTYNGMDLINADANITETVNGECTTSADCGGVDPTPTPPTPTPTPIVGDSGLCYSYTLNTSEIQLNSGLTVVYTPLGSNTTVTVNATGGVEAYDNQDGTYTYYICSKSNPIFYDGQYAVTSFDVIQYGSCDAEHNCVNNPITPTPTPTPTATPVGTYGWDCDGLGNCSYVLNGAYADEATCIANCPSGGGSGGGY
jgi:hypothetical protein